MRHPSRSNAAKRRYDNPGFPRQRLADKRQNRSYHTGNKIGASPDAGYHQGDEGERYGK
jgi:hypothetical protein